MSEQQVQKKISDYLTSIGAYNIKVIQSNKSGTPDIIACLASGNFIGIEVKQPGKEYTLSKLQQYHIGAIQASNGLALMATSVADVKSYLKEMHETF